ncbi:MAG: sigma-70 family RNA polymerase sigma factor [Gammaproteobacteria bacterium]|nr:sigma-70 family RNA polymerase sigma factor [Gammaproteobacteria bacterium]MDH4255521.1 sigma-70 family RNA polymerase sigma factor [Gammaproteobacteria bacterium]MDH5311287.1 sigma-70 family RNA polymerase sigma factor [Gammaproteobacteria bacterium]
MSDRDDLKAFFSRHVEENMDALYGVAYRLTRNAADAEDLLGEAVARAWAAIGSLADRDRFRPWLFRILRNCFISDYRRQSVRPIEQSLDDVMFTENGEQDLAAWLCDQPDEFLNWWAEPEREFYNDALGDRIMAAIDALPEVFQTTVLLVNVDGLSYDEAAEALGVPPGTIRSRMKRGRTLLQKALWAQAVDAGLAVCIRTGPDDE